MHMSYFNFQTVDQLKALPENQRNEYLNWIAGPNSNHGSTLIKLAADQPEYRQIAEYPFVEQYFVPGDWNEIAYQLPFMEKEIRRSEDKAAEYAQRTKEYEANGVTPPATWENESKAFLDNASKLYESAPDSAKGDPPPTYDSLKASVAGVSPYDSPGGVVYEREQKAKEEAVTTGKSVFDPNGNLILPSGQKISPQDPNWKTYLEQAGIRSQDAPALDPNSDATIADTTQQGGGGTNLNGGGTDVAGGGGFGSLSELGIDTTGMSESMIMTLEGMQTLANNKMSSGTMLNPDITIDDDVIARFMEEAKAELGPYYRQAFQETEDDLKVGFQRLQMDKAKRELALSKQFGQELEQTQESFAQRGLDFSSQRDKAEQNVADKYKTEIDSNIESSARQGFDLGTKGERILGSAAFPNIDTGVATGATPILNQPGVYGFQAGTGRKPLFNPLGGTTGTLERQRDFDLEKRTKEKEQDRVLGLSDLIR
uniref:Uncharacterized protein n=1 Tax=viral metagenome TaxID=1070528 RepID=A0A6M3KHU2_9ZZZZ